MDEFTLAANADAVDVAAPEGVAAPIGSEASPEASKGTQAPAAEEITQTQAFSKRLNEKIAEAERAIWEKVNPTIAKLGGTTPDGKPVQSFDDLKLMLEQQELAQKAEAENVPVELYSRLTQAEKDALEAKSMLSEYQRKEALAAESEKLRADPQWGDFFKANESDIRATAEKFKCDLGSAKLIVFDKVGTVKVDEEAIANKAIQDYLDKKRTFDRPTEGSGAAPVQVVQMPKTYKDAREGARAILRSLKE